MRRIRELLALSSLLLGCVGAPGPLVGPYAESACGACQAAACSTPLEACGADNDCVRYLWCLGSCPLAASGSPDAACEARCVSQVPATSQVLVVGVQACQGKGAGAAACVAACGAPQSTGTAFFNQQCSAPAPTGSCKECTQQRCCESRDACFGNQSCDKLYDCMAACPTDRNDPKFGPCIGQCQKTYRDAGPAYARLILCAQVRCQGSCFEPDACQTCQARYCGDHLLRYRTQQSCIDSTYCKYQCAADDMTCLQGCAAAVKDCVNNIAWPMVVCSAKFCPEYC